MSPVHEPDARYVAFADAPAGVRALTTTRRTASDPAHPSLPHAELLAHLDVAAHRVAWCAQVHGRRILASTAGGRQGEGDALVTDRSDVVLSIRTADCAPVFLVDRVGPALGLVHAGWRGAAAGIVEDTVEALHRLYGVRPEDLWAGIGPAIGPDVYEVGAEVAGAFGEEHLTPSGERWHLDLPGAVDAALRRAGVKEVSGSGICTASTLDSFFSYRAEKTDGRLYSLLWRTS